MAKLGDLGEVFMLIILRCVELDDFKVRLVSRFHSVCCYQETHICLLSGPWTAEPFGWKEGQLEGS